MSRLSKLLLFSLLGITINAQAVGNFTKLESLTSIRKLKDGQVEFTAIKTNNGIELGYPLDLIGETNMFGAAIVKVSDKENEEFGNLKLSHLTAPVKTELVNTTEKQALLIKGHYWEGSETQAPEQILEIPITKIDAQNKLAYLDLASLGEKLDIALILTQKAGEQMEAFKHVSSKTVSVDFSLKVLVFDVESTYTHSTAKEGTTEVTTQNVTFTTRWFLRLNSGADAFFERRKNTEGVGYFTTASYNPGEPVNDWIARFPIHDLKNNPVKYYVKNVPNKYKPAILSGIEDWNHKLQSTLGHDLITYEILDKGDPRYDQILAGDVRYNVLEWDTDNQASYGGLGPSLKNSITGQILAAQTLIQGPAIVGIYTTWFKVKDEAKALRSHNKHALADKIEKDFLKSVFKKHNSLAQKKIAKVKISGFQFQVPSQDPKLKDPITVNPLDYLEIPAGYTFETYMNGYWREIVSHELGHNLGLRHNFRGNLKDPGTGTVGSTSWSVMEYLPRTHRHLNRVSEYDVMAIAYGYLGVMPTHKDRFCTDENQAIYSFKNSAECSNADATNDPISFFEKRINRGLDLLLARNSKSTPEWTMKEVWGTMSGFIRHLAAYAYSAPMTAQTWTNFFGKEGRPENGDDVPAYIIAKLNGFICNENLEKEISNKESPEAQAKTQENLNAYRKAAFDLLKKSPAPWSIVSPQNFPCYKE